MVPYNALSLWLFIILLRTISLYLESYIDKIY